MQRPTIGRPLPRAEHAYSSPEKWALWILAGEHHGPDWRRVFGLVDRETVWAALASSVVSAPVASVRAVIGGRVTCRVDLPLTINDRTATVRSIWHYADDDAAPRLVTAFPTT